MGSRDMLILSVFTLITIIAWISFDLYHAITTSKITDVQQELIVPLDPEINREIIKELKTKQ